MSGSQQLTALTHHPCNILVCWLLRQYSSFATQFFPSSLKYKCIQLVATQIPWWLACLLFRSHIWHSMLWSSAFCVLLHTRDSGLIPGFFLKDRYCNHKNKKKLKKKRDPSKSQSSTVLWKNMSWRREWHGKVEITLVSGFVLGSGWTSVHEKERQSQLGVSSLYFLVQWRKWLLKDHIFFFFSPHHVSTKR